MTFNVGTFNGKPADISRIASIAAKPEAPDVLILQEVHGEESCRYLAERLGLSFWVFSGYPAGIDDGLAAISRYPVKFLKSFHFDPYGALMVDIDLTLALWLFMLYFYITNAKWIQGESK